jgi:hypothetical protein
MPTWTWILTIVAAAIVVGLIAFAAWGARRTRTLQQAFGPEYDRMTAGTESRREAEAELTERQKRHEELDIRPLTPAARDRYLSRWEEIQARFVDDPEGAVAAADNLIQQVMRERGYPVDDFERRSADLSVDHPDVVEHYRAGHAIATTDSRGDSRTEDLRQAMTHFRSLFEELLVTEREPAAARR